MNVTGLFEEPYVIDDSGLQISPDGRLRHLLTLKTLGKEHIFRILDEAETFLSPLGHPAVRAQCLKGLTVANLFFEPSTRTRASFDLAAKRLGADVLNLDVNTSSRKKGESIIDTIYTLQAMQIDVFVVRDASAGVSSYIAQNVEDHVSILNAGEAEVSHPTQGLLDLLTIRQHKPNFENLIVTIVGDISHSRVARSAVHGLTTLGVAEIRLVSPKELAPDPADMPNTKIMSSLDEGIRGADVVMALRIQRERIDSLDDIPGIDEYFANYGISHERMKYAAQDAIVMHPGPMNRGIEIESSLADSSQSVITKQVTNGVAIRMAILTSVTKTVASS
jgi:aspartate carbamoyltransferase catalytic subunit